jgi:SAM-dependent methyltransferase
MTKQTCKVARRVVNDRLAYYLNAPNAGFWDQHWYHHFSPAIYQWAEQGALGWFKEPFTHYLPRNGRILEAGCGLGQYVLSLRVRGYDAEGVEWGTQTVESIRALYPDLPVRVGDVSRLEIPDHYYVGYISLGVAEHRQDGPEPLLEEAFRVLAPGGVALISVPYFHPLRRLKARLGLYRGQVDGLEFYQYAFTENEFSGLLEEAGFQVIDRMPYDGFKGVKDEIPLLRKMMKWRWIGCRLQNRLQSWKWAGKLLGHMILFVCRKAP